MSLRETFRPSTWAPSPGRLLQLTAQGVKHLEPTPRNVTRNLRDAAADKGGSRKRARQCKHDLQPETDVTSVIETATRAKDFSVTTRAAPEEQTRSLPTTLVNPDRQRLRVIGIYERVS